MYIFFVEKVGPIIDEVARKTSQTRSGVSKKD